MATTILQLLQDAAVELKLVAPATIIGNSSEDARSLLAYLIESGKATRDRYDWPVLTREYGLSLVDGQSSYALPADYNKFVTATHWDRSNHWELIGPVSPQWWNYRQYGIAQLAPRREYRVRGASGSQLLIHPTPGTTDAGDVLGFEYVSRNWLRPRQWQQGQITDASEYVWNEGNLYQAIAGGTTGATAPSHTTGTASDGGINWQYTDGPYQRPLRDSDCVLLDEDLLRLGVKWRWRESNGFPYAEFKAEYELRLMQAKSELEGPSVVDLRGGRRSRLIGEASIPEGSWNT
jgi:hypothetical protein